MAYHLVRDPRTEVCQSFEALMVGLLYCVDLGEWGNCTLEGTLPQTLTGSGAVTPAVCPAGHDLS